MSRSSSTLNSATWIRSARSGSSLMREDAAVGAGQEPVVDRLGVAERAALGHLGRVDVADEVADAGVGRRELLGVAVVAVPPLDRHVVAVACATSVRQRWQIGASGSSWISQPAMYGDHSSSSPPMVRISRVLPWPRSPSRTMSCPASSARWTSGSTLSSKPTMPGKGFSPARSRRTRFARISALTVRGSCPEARSCPMVAGSGWWVTHSRYVRRLGTDTAGSPAGPGRSARRSGQTSFGTSA